VRARARAPDREEHDRREAEAQERDRRRVELVEERRGQRRAELDRQDGPQDEGQRRHAHD
jgi:hypothetical protein